MSTFEQPLLTLNFDLGSIFTLTVFSKYISHNINDKKSSDKYYFQMYLFIFLITYFALLC